MFGCAFVCVVVRVFVCVCVCMYLFARWCGVAVVAVVVNVTGIAVVVRATVGGAVVSPLLWLVLVVVVPSVVLLL